MREKIAAILWISLVSVACPAQRDLRADSVVIEHIHLAINLTDFNTKTMQGDAVLHVKAKQSGVQSLRFDLLALQVDSVRINGTYNTFTHNDSLLIIPLTAPLSTTTTTSVRVFYHGHPLQETGDFGGFYWTNEYAFNIGVSFLSNPHNYGRVWFPCFDNFVTRSSYSFAITTLHNMRAFCNGQLDSTGIAPSGNKIWYWHISEKIPSYLASVAVADYRAVQDTIHALKGKIPVLLVAKEADTTKLKNSFIHLKNAFRTYEKHFGPYEWNRVGFCIVPFSAGGMEHATNVSYFQVAVNGHTTYENVMAHELSHHWFGNLTTCDEAKDMWLNEGWATYCERLFFEDLVGRQRYKSDVRTAHEEVLHLAHIKDSAYLAVGNIPITKTYSNLSVYAKGADRVHTLRSYMGDSAFFGCLKSYLQFYKMKDVNSTKLRDYLRACSGLSNLTDFFADWVFDGGFPHFSIDDKRITQQGSDYLVELNIRQRLLHASHYFTNVPLPISFFDAHRNRLTHTFLVSGSCTYLRITLPFQPVYIALDFDELLSDATTDEWKTLLASSGNYNFGTAKCFLQPKLAGIDSSLVRIEHHWVAPDASKNHIPNLHLSDYRYWTIDGVWDMDFHANARFFYNGTATANGYLDNTFITNTEDSIVLMYRPDAKSDWWFADSVTYDRGNLTDKVGSVTVYNVRKGEYCFAIYQAGKVDSPQAASGCFPLSLTNMSDNEHIRVFPNPTCTSEFFVVFDGEEKFASYTLTDFTGKVVLQEKIQQHERQLQLSLAGCTRGIYMLQLVKPTGELVVKQVVYAGP